MLFLTAILQLVYLDIISIDKGSIVPCLWYGLSNKGSTVGYHREISSRFSVSAAVRGLCSENKGCFAQWVSIVFHLCFEMHCSH